MCVSIERELLAGNSWLGTMLSIAVGTSQVHSAINVGETDRTWDGGILRGIAGVDRVLLVPGLCGWVRMSGDQMNVVVDWGKFIACDQQAFPWRESGRHLHVNTLLDGTTGNLLTAFSYELDGREDGVEMEHTEVSSGEDTYMLDTSAATSAELGEGDERLVSESG
jgi:hypothetical protein